MHFANLVSCFVCFYEFIWRKFNNWAASILLESFLFLDSNSYEVIEYYLPYKIFNLNMVQICSLITRHPMSYSKKIHQISNTDSLHFSDSMETEEKTGSVPVGKTPETVS